MKGNEFDDDFDLGDYKPNTKPVETKPATKVPPKPNATVMDDYGDFDDEFNADNPSTKKTDKAPVQPATLPKKPSETGNFDVIKLSLNQLLLRQTMMILVQMTLLTILRM